jgi:hypothetical protein
MREPKIPESTGAMIQARKTYRGCISDTAGLYVLGCFTNLNNTLLDIYRTVLLVANPGDTGAAKGTDTHAQDTAKDRVGSRNGETKAGSKGEVAGRGNDGTNHAQHEKSRALIKGLDVDDLCSDSISNSATNAEGAAELHDTGANHGLEVADGTGGNRRGP